MAQEVEHLVAAGLVVCAANDSHQEPDAQAHEHRAEGNLYGHEETIHQVAPAVILHEIHLKRSDHTVPESLFIHGHSGNLQRLAILVQIAGPDFIHSAIGLHFGHGLVKHGEQIRAVLADSHGIFL